LFGVQTINSILIDFECERNREGSMYERWKE